MTLSLNDGFYLTDGGLETTMIYMHNQELPEFAAFTLLDHPKGKNLLKEYFRSYVELAKNYDLNFIFESPTWRASSRWGKILGYSSADLAKLNTSAIELLAGLNDKGSNNLISGCIGSKYDGYSPEAIDSLDDYKKYHADQVKIFKESEVDMITALTMTSSNEALAIVMVAEEFKLPVVISYTVETDGALPSGETLKEAILKVDKKTNNYVSHYMINCAHPKHFSKLFNGEEWTMRIKGIRSNASSKSHAELDCCDYLDRGDENELTNNYKELFGSLPQLKIIGGCCGTDLHHMKMIVDQLTSEE